MQYIWDFFNTDMKDMFHDKLGCFGCFVKFVILSFIFGGIINVCILGIVILIGIRGNLPSWWSDWIPQLALQLR